MATCSSTKLESLKKSQSNYQSSSRSPFAKSSSSMASNRSTYGTNSKQPIGNTTASVLRSTDTAPESSGRQIVHKYASIGLEQSQTNKMSKQPFQGSSYGRSTIHQSSDNDEPKLIQQIPSFRNPRSRDRKTSDEPSQRSHTTSHGNHGNNASRMSQSTSHGNHGDNGRSTESRASPPNGYTYVTVYAWDVSLGKYVGHPTLQRI